jgi:transcriptional regulator with XRE-family HTH domain
MSEAQFDAERAKLRERGETSVQRTARWEQDLARLFYRSGWTQEELAKKEGKSQSQIDRLLRFGRFLHLPPPGVNLENLPNNLTERHFRNYWEQTSGASEGPRFREVLRMIQQDTTLAKSHTNYRIGPSIVKQFADGKWHKLDTIVAHAAAPAQDIWRTLNQMRRKGSYGAKCESEKVGKSFQFRIFKQEKMVSVQELTEKLGPLIKGLEAEGKKSPATTSPGTVARLTALLKRHIEEWGE